MALAAVEFVVCCRLLEAHVSVQRELADYAMRADRPRPGHQGCEPKLWQPIALRTPDFDMVNDPMPWQLTVAQLKEELASAQDGAVVGLLLRAGFAAYPDFDG